MSHGKFSLIGRLIDTCLIISCVRYKNGKRFGKVWGPWPGSSLHYLETLSTPRWEDYDIKYVERNRFAYLGNGSTKRERDGGDLSYYLREPGAGEGKTALA